MSRHAVVKTIQQIERRPSSRNGNPRFLVTFTDGGNALTVVDAACAYGLGNRENMAPNEVEVTFDGRGRIEFVTPVSS